MKRIPVKFSEDTLAGVRVKIGENIVIIPMDKLQLAVNYALAQAKASGEFDGDDYILTDADVEVIAELAAKQIDLSDIAGDDIKDAVYDYLTENPIDTGVKFTPGNALELTNNGILNVKTTDDAEPDNTLPITSSGVNTIVGNIGAILDTI